jgi:hypothetical protein
MRVLGDKCFMEDMDSSLRLQHIKLNQFTIQVSALRYIAEKIGEDKLREVSENLVT